MIEYTAASFIAGASLLALYHRMKTGGYKALASQIIHQAEKEAQEMRHSNMMEVQSKLLQAQHEIDGLKKEEKNKISAEIEQIRSREKKLDEQLDRVEKKLLELEKREAKLNKSQKELDNSTSSLERQKEEILAKLERISNLTAEEASNQLMQQLKADLAEETASTIHRAKIETEKYAEREAAEILSTAIQRLAAPTASESTVNTIAIPNDEIKRRIIGREGRNIKTLEKLTGINFSIDITPGAVVLSGYDPFRLQVAKLALTDLIQDGRIHPTRIEELVEKAQKNVAKQIKHYGDDAAIRTGAFNLHPELINLLGLLKLRYSYGQNVLEHSIEVSHLMGLMAAELKLDVRKAKRIGLLHDIGKAASHDNEGSHALVGRDLALKYGETADIANGIGCHHHEIPATTIEGSLCNAADAISASRPGARIEAIEEYMQRLKNLEAIALRFPGVESAYALQAGREVRIIVKADEIDDNGSLALARDVSKQIETELSYPGRIKITVSREKRITSYAH